MDVAPRDLHLQEVVLLAEPIVVLSAALLWIATGYRALALLSQRGGSHLSGWATLGMVLGPLLAAWSLVLVKRQGDAPEVIELAPGSRGPGDLSVVVVVLGEPERVAAVDHLLTKLPDRVGEVVLIRPLTGGAADERRPAATASDARTLSQAGLFISGFEARLLLLAGDGATSVDRLPLRHRPDLVVVVGADRGLRPTQMERRDAGPSGSSA